MEKTMKKMVKVNKKDLQQNGKMSPRKRIAIKFSKGKK